MTANASDKRVRQIQNFDLCCFSVEKIEGIWVEVCSYGRSCLPCGILTSTPRGHWGGVYCLGGMISGNEVQLRHSYQTLVLCEVEIFGKTTSKLRFK